MTESSMALFVFGTSYSTAPAGLRERIHVDPDDLYDMLKGLRRRSTLDGAVPLGTCARLELYGASKDPGGCVRRLRALVARATGVGRGEVEEHAYFHQGRDAVRHLFRVASGLESAVHGEAQILGQVRDAILHPRTAEAVTPELFRLFERAVSTGKRVRTETEIGRGVTSLAGAALRMLEQELGSLERLHALVIGAGQTGTSVARLLSKAGVGRLTVANRTLERGERLARELGADAAGLEDLPRLIPKADFVVGAVGGRGGLVGPDTLPDEESGPRLFLDLAHPRNFDPGLGNRPGMVLYDLADIFRRVSAAEATRAQHLPTAERIVDEETDSFVSWLRSRANVATLRAVREHVLTVALAQAERFSEGRTSEERERLRLMARSLARTLLHAPTVALREADPETDEGQSLLCSATALFGVDGPGLERPEPR